MSDYIVKDTELTSVANAIRIKGGTNSQLVFPNGFVSAIGNISGGGGSSDFSTAEVTLNATVDGSLPIASIVDNQILTTVPFFIESFEAVLYKGSQVFYTSGVEGTITTSGDAVYDSDEQTITITGDCSITIS